MIPIALFRIFSKIREGIQQGAPPMSMIPVASWPMTNRVGDTGGALWLANILPNFRKVDMTVMLQSETQGTMIQEKPEAKNLMALSF